MRDQREGDLERFAGGRAVEILQGDNLCERWAIVGISRGEGKQLGSEDDIAAVVGEPDAAADEPLGMVVTESHDDCGGYAGIFIGCTVSWRHIAFAVNSGGTRRTRGQN